MAWLNRIRSSNSSRESSPNAHAPSTERLALACAHLEQIEYVRAHWHNPDALKAAEERIIWRELLDLELQEIDEQIERMPIVVGENADQW